MTITFFKQQELIDANNLMSTAGGENALARATVAWHNNFYNLVTNINNNIKSVIAGWRRGYTPEAVADWIVYGNRYATNILGDDFESLESKLVDQMFALMGYASDNWGGQYNYVPALEEIDRDPLTVQLEINDRAKENGKLGPSETVYFGSYQNNTGTVKTPEEVNEMIKFRAAVVKVLSERQRQFFTNHVEDTENV